jgi:Tol biopolymer transport system component
MAGQGFMSSRTVWAAIVLAFSHTAISAAAPFEADMLFHSLRHGASQIYLANSISGQTQRLRESTDEDIDATWSPDGGKIAFVSRHNGNSDVYVADADGKNILRLTDSPVYDGAARWSPDGRKLAFISGRSGSNKLYLVNADGSGLKRLTSNDSLEDETNHAWSPDGKRVAYVAVKNRKMAIWLVNSDGSDAAKLTGMGDSNEIQPAWSPDGKELAFVEARKGRANLRVMHLASKEVRKLTDDDFRSSKPMWTPDGKHIVFESLRAGGARTDVFVVPATGGEATNLTQHPAEEMDAALSGNGQQLAFVSFRAGAMGQVYTLDLATKSLRQLTDTGKLEFRPTWRPVAGKQGRISDSGKSPAGT